MSELKSTTELSAQYHNPIRDSSEILQHLPVEMTRSQSDAMIKEGVDHYKRLFSFVQRKVEYENFRFKHPSLLAVVIESINNRVTEKQRDFTYLFFRFGKPEVGKPGSTSHKT